MAELTEKPELPRPTPGQCSRCIAWLQRIEHALRRLAAIAFRVADLRDRRQHDDGAPATFLIELDDRRKRRVEARKAIASWLDVHPWQVRLTRMMGGAERKPPELVALEGSAFALHTYIPPLKRGGDVEHRVAELDSRIGLAEGEMRLMHGQVQAATASVVALAPIYQMALLSVADAEHVPALTAALPPPTPLSTDPDVTVTLRTPDGVLALKPDAPRAARPSM